MKASAGLTQGDIWPFLHRSHAVEDYFVSKYTKIFCFKQVWPNKVKFGWFRDAQFHSAYFVNICNFSFVVLHEYA